MQTPTVRYANVIIPVPLPAVFTYAIPTHLIDFVTPGKRVVVQFGPKRVMSGIVRRVTDQYPHPTAPKEIMDVLDEEPLLSEHDLSFWEWIARYYLCTTGEVMQAALPALLRLESQTSVSFHPEFDGKTENLSDKEFLIAEALRYSPKLTLNQLSDITGQKRVINLLQGLIEKQVVVTSETLINSYRPKQITTVSLAQEYHQEEALKELFETLEKRAFKQLELLMSFIRIAGENLIHKAIPAKELLTAANASGAILKSMVGKGIFAEKVMEITRLEQSTQSLQIEDLTLSQPQKEALYEITSGFDEGKPVLLHGVTGSGKTEIYIHLINQVIQQKKQVLYLLPEIALTSQIINRMRSYFGSRVQVFHSRTNDQERTELWNRLAQFTGAEDDPCIVVSARSGIFLPLRKPGLIIVDEEHDHSFKQYDPAPRYQARDAALMLAKKLEIPILLGSATPSVESYFHAANDRFQLVNLTVRYGNASMPEVVVADVAEATRKREMHVHFTPQLVHKIKTALSEKLQIILFQNRRGFSLRMYCTSCGWHPGCPQCDVTLTYHKYIHKLKCHYCGYIERVPGKCTECESTDVRTAGFGTEKIEEEISILFPKARVQRMDYDTTRTKNAYQKIISEFEQKKTDILIGTQMVTKGLDFSHVGVVGVMNADSMIYYPDFRSFERSFQHIVQVSGRAGRQKHPGVVVIQTNRPSHDVIRLSQKNLYEEMYRLQHNERNQFGYPPFTRLIRIIIKAKTSELAGAAARELAETLRTIIPDPVLGPEFPPVAKIKNEYLRHILIKMAKNETTNARKQQIRNIVTAVKQKNSAGKVKFVVDVDPY
jgi:primosomal protein N' (replication factor Y) (superfamily II helicase)